MLSLWRNRLARSAVNRKVGGSSPPRDDFFSFFFKGKLGRRFFFFIFERFIGEGSQAPTAEHSIPGDSPVMWKNSTRPESN